MQMSAVNVRSAGVACAAGVLFATMYTLSPMTVWFMVAVAIIGAYASRGLTGRERRVVRGLFALALAARVLALSVFFLITSHGNGSFVAMIPDEDYIFRRAMWLRNIALEVPIARADFIDSFNPFAESGFLYMLGYLQMIVGPAPYGMRLLGVASYLAAAAILYRMVRPTFGAPAAVTGLALLLFWPSAFVWSISALKEPPYYFLSAVALASIVAAVRAPSVPSRLMALLTCVGAVVVVATVRNAGAIMAGGGVAAGLLLTFLMRNRVWMTGALALSVAAAGWALTDRDIHERTRQFFQGTAVTHIGHVKTPGRAYKLLEPEFYTRLGNEQLSYPVAAASMDDGDIARYLIRATLSFSLVPFPWQVSSGVAIAYLPLQVVWFVLVVCAIPGMFAGLRRDALITLLLAATIAIAAAAITLTSGNIGTFVRHRDMTLIPMAWLSGLGMVSVAQFIAGRRRSGALEPESEYVGV
jgi:4-amino-4-deoxy-L-arabinose transferase-like glycosyltransferase